MTDNATDQPTPAARRPHMEQAEIEALRERMELEVRKRRRQSMLVSVGVLAVSIVVAAIGAGSGTDLGSFAGRWRYGLVVLGGAALLFSYTLWLLFAVEYRNKAAAFKRADAPDTATPERAGHGESTSLSI